MHQRHGQGLQHINREYVEITYIEGACGVSGWDEENNESVCERFDMCERERSELWSGGAG